MTLTDKAFPLCEVSCVPLKMPLTSFDFHTHHTQIVLLGCAPPYDS